MEDQANAQIVPLGSTNQPTLRVVVPTAMLGSMPSWAKAIVRVVVSGSLPLQQRMLALRVHQAIIQQRMLETASPAQQVQSCSC